MGLSYNLGSGSNYKPGFINVDKSPEARAEIHTDIKVTPWKWAKTNSADRIEASNTAEHIEAYSWIQIVRECHRVLKPGGILFIKAPILAVNNLDAVFSDPTHVNYNFTDHTFDYYDHRHLRWINYGKYYGIPPFERLQQARRGRFIIATLKVIK